MKRTVTVLAVLLLSAPAGADPPRRPFDVENDTPPQPVTVARLDYSRGPGAASCPAEDFLRSAVGAHVGRDPFPKEAPRKLTVRVAREGAGYAVTLSIDSPAWSHPPLRGADCADLLRNAAVAIAVQLDPAPTAPVAAAPTVVVLDAPETPAAPPPAPSTRPRVMLGVLAAADFGTLPATSLRLSLDAGIRWRFASVVAEGQAWLPVERDGIRAYAFGGSVLGCGHIPLMASERLTVTGCGLINAGALRAEWHAAGSALLVGGGARLGLDLRLGPVVLQMGGDVLARHPVTVQQAGVATWTAKTVSGTLGGGAVAHF